MSPHSDAVVGLRERKKAKTRELIQRQAFRLFRAHGYDGTTVEQIAAAAEVSPSTFFRYFPTKEEVVLWDALDPLMIEHFATQPPGMTPVAALRSAFRAVYAGLTPEQLVEQRDRLRLVAAVPELRAATLDRFTGTAQLVAEMIADRVGRPADDFELRALAGAVIGVAFSVMLAAGDDDSVDYLSLFDDGLGFLETGFPLSAPPATTS